MRIKEFFIDTNHGDSLFTSEEISAIEARISSRTVKGKDSTFITCLVRKKEFKLTPEEFVRQLYIYRLINGYGYPVNRLQVEFAVNFGREVKRADAVTFAAQFYSSLGFGYPVQKAYEQAKSALMLVSPTEQDTPELYLKDGIDANSFYIVRPNIE